MYELDWESGGKQRIKKQRLYHNLKVIKVGLGKVKVVLREITPKKEKV